MPKVNKKKIKKKARRLSKRDYSKKIYLSGDKDDLRKSFPKGAMVIWALICLVGAIFVLAIFRNNFNNSFDFGMDFHIIFMGIKNMGLNK